MKSPGLLAAALLTVAVAAHAAAPGSVEFDAGVRAFHAADYAGARRAFLDARAAGLDTPQLRFDLALALYELHLDDDAQAAFERLRASPGFESIADFHLGLVAHRRGDDARARALWQDVATQAPQEPLRARARKALARLERTGPEGWAYLSALAGHDGNPAMFDENEQPGGAGASTVQLFGSGSVPLGAGGLSLRGGAYLYEYSGDVAPDPRGVFAALNAERRSGPRRTSAGLDVAVAQLDSEPYTNLYTLSAAAEPAAGAGGWALRGALARIDAAATYAYLEGWRVRAEIEDTLLGKAARLRLAYQFEGNDRADLDTGSEFFSHSPLRNRFSAVLDHGLYGALTAQESVRFRHSRWRDSNRFVENGVARSERRAEALFTAGLQLRWGLGRGFAALGGAEYSHNTSTINSFAYDRTVLTLGLEWAS